MMIERRRRCVRTRVDFSQGETLRALFLFSRHAERRQSRMVFLLVREITIERAFLLPVKVHRGFIMVIESPERGRAEIL